MCRLVTFVSDNLVTFQVESVPRISDIEPQKYPFPFVLTWVPVYFTAVTGRTLLWRCPWSLAFLAFLLGIPGYLYRRLKIILSMQNHAKMGQLTTELLEFGDSAPLPLVPVGPRSSRPNQLRSSPLPKPGVLPHRICHPVSQSRYTHPHHTPTHTSRASAHTPSPVPPAVLQVCRRLGV